MPLFACSGYRGYPDVEAGNAREAARFFADLRAKSEYGAGGECTFIAATAGSVLIVRRQLPWDSLRGFA